MIDSEWRQHWRILPPCIAGIILCAVHGYTLGVMMTPLEQEFGWARAEISAGLLILSVVALFFAPIAGTFIDKFGPRRIGLFGVGFFCLSLGMLSTATSSILSWWGLWVVMAIASMFVLPTVWTVAINGYFDKNRGMALAIALSGTGITAAIIPVVTSYLVEFFGWRGAYIGLAIICFAVVFPLVWFLFHPVDSGKAATSGGLNPPSPARVLKGFSAREGLRSASFLKIAAAVVVFSIALSALTTNAVPVLLAQGMTATTAAGLAGLIGVGSVIGRLGGGYLLDRLNAHKVAACSVLLPIIAIGFLLAFPGLFAGAAVACFFLGLSVGTEVDACAYLAAKHFGLRSFGTLFGAINGLMLFSNGVGPILANSIYDVTQSYNLVLWALIPMCLIASVFFLLLGPYPVFEEPAPEPAIP